MNARAVNCLLGTSIAAWGLVVGAGLFALYSYENTASAQADAPRLWPSESKLEPHANSPTLVLFAHPRCPCTRAAIEELSRIHARAPKPPRTYVVFVHPQTSQSDWHRTDLWKSAAAIPGVVTIDDRRCEETIRFGAQTSGQALLYAADGQLLFAGGITASRGHSGDNAGALQIVALLKRPSETRSRAGGSRCTVFGCPLFHDPR